MKQLNYEDYEDFACAVIDTLDEITESDDCNDISIIAKYESANQILKELLCLGCDIASIELHREEFEEYWDENIISIVKDDDKYEVWCEKFKRETGYFKDESTVTYIMDDCNSAVIPFCKGKTIYEVAVGDEDECDGDCDNRKEYYGETDDGSVFHVKVVGDLDLDEAMAKLDEMETRMSRMSEMFDEMTNFKKLINW